MIESTVYENGVIAFEETQYVYVNGGSVPVRITRVSINNDWLMSRISSEVAVRMAEERAAMAGLVTEFFATVRKAESFDELRDALRSLEWLKRMPRQT